MSTITLLGNPAGGGAVTLQSPASAVSRVLTLPDVDGDLSPAALELFAGTMAGAGTHQVSVPAWARQIELTVYGMSTSGNSAVPGVRALTAAGLGGATYGGSASVVWTSHQTEFFSTDAVILSPAAGWSASITLTGRITLTRVCPYLAGELWTADFTLTRTDQPGNHVGGCYISLPAKLTGVQISTRSADTYDNGYLNIRAVR